MAESFMRTLKREEVDGRTYRDLPHAREKIVAFIDTVYNRQRLHSARAYRAPELFEDDCHEVCLSFLSHQRGAVQTIADILAPLCLGGSTTGFKTPAPSRKRRGLFLSPSTLSLPPVTGAISLK